MTATAPAGGASTGAVAGSIVGVEVWDLRFPLPGSAGSDARHADPVYSLPVCLLHTDADVTGTGITLTLGAGNDLVCRAVAAYAARLVGADVESVVADLGRWWRILADDSQLRWLGPHKGVTHLALASVLAAVLDAWALGRGRPLWELLLELPADALLAMTDLRTLEDVVPDPGALVADCGDGARQVAAHEGLPGYDTSVGWLGYPIERLVEEAHGAVEAGFSAVKVKIGSDRLADDVARVAAVRDVLGPHRRVMIDANQAFTVPQAVAAGRALAELEPFWFEEPVHPDDLVGYRTVQASLPGIRIAGGEHLPNQVAFKAFLDAGVLDVAQPDVVRLGGLPELLGVGLLAAHHGRPIAPHVGDMGQLHQHLVPLLSHRLGCEPMPLEHIPHLRHVFAEPARVRAGRYHLPSLPGASTALLPSAFAGGDLVWRTGRSVAR